MALVCFIIGAVCVCLLAVVLHNFVFVIKNVKVEGNVYCTAESIIASSGIVSDEPMYSINKDEIAKNIKKANPYVDTVSVKRDLPSDIRIIVSESTPACYVSIADEHFVISDTLRVLEYTEDIGKVCSLSKKRVLLPEISCAILGEKLGFFSVSDTDYISDVIRAVSECKLADRVEVISLKNKFDIYVVCDGLYRIECGSASDISLKLEVAEAIISSGKLEPDVRAAINVSDPNEGTVVADKDMILVPDVQE